MQPIGNTGERFCSLCLKDSGVLYEDPYIQVFSSFFTNIIETRLVLKQSGGLIMGIWFFSWGTRILLLLSLFNL
ncbi:hypothetical protein JHK82_033160 [Glycine max]|nr:hypothetical protein JHK82_033160 [Glycine max]